MTSDAEIIEYLFWTRVRRCLVNYHKLSVSSASGKTRRFRSEIPRARSAAHMDLIFHMKPFDVACKIAESKLEYAKFRDNYLEMLADTRHLRPPQRRPVIPMAEVKPLQHAGLWSAKTAAGNYKRVSGGVSKKASVKPRATEKRSASKKASPKKAAPRKPASKKR